MVEGIHALELISVISKAKEKDGLFIAAGDADLCIKALVFYLNFSNAIHEKNREHLMIPHYHSNTSPRYTELL